MWRRDDPQGNESAKIKWEIVPYTNGTGLDLGCGPFKAFKHFIGVDNGHHWGTQGIDVPVKTCEKLSYFADGSMDFVFSSHLLEHIEDTSAALKEWWRVIKDGGYLILYLPHKDYYPNVGQEGANPDHKHDFIPDDIIGFMRELGAWDLLENQERNEDREYSFFQVFKKGGEGQRLSYLNTKPEKTAAVCRYGAFGDLIQTSSIVAGYKKQGYHVTLYTTKEGMEVVKHDPNIDEFIIQGKDQVPNPELGDWWAHLAKKYDRFTNLSESVEGTLLAMPGRISHTWPKSMRDKHLNSNYLEFMHDLSELPYEPAQKFFPTQEEKEWAKKEKKTHGKAILWSLAGSAVHKTWPYLDTIIARLLTTYPDWKVILVGDTLCQVLEQGWEKEPRVICRSGVWSIRESLSFAQVADLVIGPETGVLNAVAFDDVPKIITLSHSSENNLTRDWKNTCSLKPEKTSCYPCHMMHYNFDHCHRHEETGVALCQANISADLMWIAINQALRGK